MRSKPANWDTGLANTNHYYSSTVQVVLPNQSVGNVFTERDLMSLEGSSSLYGETYGVGGTVMNQITLTVDLGSFTGLTPQNINIDDYITKMSKVTVSTRLMVGSTTYGTISYGVFYADRPEYDRESGHATVTAYDPMFYTNVKPFEEGSTVSTWDSPSLQQVAEHIVEGTDVVGVIESNFAGAGIVGGDTIFTLEDIKQIPNNIFMGSIPYNFTVREILADIAASACGNWTMIYKSGDWKLRLVSKLDSDQLKWGNLIDENGDVLIFGNDGILV